MKLVILLLVVACSAQRDHSQFNHQSFQIPPQFHTNNIGPFVSQSSLYLPPETQTTIPYFPLKPNNGIPYPLLPITGTKAPMMFPSPFPIMSSSFHPHDDEDEEDSEIQQPPQAQRNYTRPQNQQMQQMKPEKKELRPVPKSIPNNFNQIDRIDLKFQAEPEPGHSEQFQHAPQMIRRTLSTPSGVNPPFGNDNSIPDQLKTASHAGGQYIPPPPGYVPPTEPAIPILRLSNEMDLDGSFSYEALSADQTHYVQHSRIENAGTDHEEQVVEGSYSYVGDNGQTYTVHYVADSNGFRASGEHLPIPPPMPEIIQRAVQYNLAAEATRPHNQQGFYEDPQETEIRPRPIPPPPQYSPPQRNLFTGRPPEAFSHSRQNHNKDTATSNQNNNSNGGSNSNQNNNLQASASSQAPVIAHIDFMKEQNDKSSGSAPIAPQITFLASQGAHVPSTPPPQTPPPISRRHYFGTEAPLFVQPIHNNFYKKQYDFMNNYVNDKNLWGYRYEPNRNVNSISRSSGDESDDVVINFNDMTSDQYSNILKTRFDNAERSYDKKSEFNSKMGYQSTVSPVVSTTQKYYQNTEYTMAQYQPPQMNYKPQPQLQYDPVQTYEFGSNGVIKSTLNTSSNSYYDNVIPNSTSPTPIKNEYTTQMSIFSTSPMSSKDQSHEAKHKNQIQSENNVFESPKESRTYNYVDHSKLLTQKSFVPPSQTVTQSYDYEMEYYEPRKLQSRRLETMATKTTESLPQPGVSVSSSSSPHDKSEPLIYESANHFRPLVTENSEVQSTEATPLTSFLSSEKNDNFDKYKKDESFTTSKSTIATELQYSNEVKNVQVKVLNDVEDENRSELAENIFLKNILSPELPKNNSISRNDNSRFTPIVYVQKPDHRNKEPKHISNKSKYMNEIKDTQKTPLDLSQILNFVTMKNHFESNKLKSKKLSEQPINTNFENKGNQESGKHRYYTDQNDTQNDDNRSEKMQKIVKIYKTLQRNKASPEQNIQQDLTPPSHDYKTLHMDMEKPPLGRAGPSMKSYLPPTYV